MRYALILLVAILASSCSGQKNTPQKQEGENTVNNNIRESVLAGSWYPADADSLREIITGYMNGATVSVPAQKLFALVSPHAGYQYSGPVAAYGAKVLQEQAKHHKIRTIVIVGFRHRIYHGAGGISVWAKGAWDTPLGRVPIDEPLAEAIIAADPSHIRFDREAHRDEHSLEIEVPFLQVALGDNLKIVPISYIAESLQDERYLLPALEKALDGRDDVVVLISTDMSHYHPYRVAEKMDRLAIDYLLSGDREGYLNALADRKIEFCGYIPILTLIDLARDFGVKDVVLFHYANSGDIPPPVGDSSRVVGYCSVGYLLPAGQEEMKLAANNNEDAVPGTADYSLTRDEKLYLLRLARKTIEQYVKSRQQLQPSTPDDPKLTEKAAVFVTLEKQKMLRGCIGQMVAQGPLYLAVRDMAISAATRDHRFSPVSPSELDDIDIEVSVLSPMKRVASYKDIRPRKDGVYLVQYSGGYPHTGVFLPQVWDEIPDEDAFLSELCSQKAGLPRDCYKKPDTEIYTFTVLKFNESELGLK